MNEHILSITQNVFTDFDSDKGGAVSDQIGAAPKSCFCIQG